MPITGLTDRESAQTDMRLRSIGKIRKGEKRGDKLIDLDHFRFVANESFKGAEKAFFNVYGREPRMLFGHLPFATMEENFSTWKEKWTRKMGLIHRCNGRHMVQWLDDDHGYVTDYELEIKKPCPYGPLAEDGAPDDKPCKQVGRLSLILPDLMRELVTNGAEYGLEQAPLGFVTLVTTSEHDLANLTRELLALENQGGRNGLQGMPVVIRRVRESVGVRFQGNNGDTIKTKSDKWMLHIDTTNDFVLNQLQAQEKRRQLEAENGYAPEEAKALIGPGDDALDVVDAEYTEPELVSDDNPFEEPEPAGEPEDEAAEEAEQKVTRPYTPATLKEMITKGIEKRRKDDFAFDNGDLSRFKGAMNNSLELCFAGNKHSDQRRHFVLEYLTGHASSNDLDDAQIKTVHRWLNASKDESGEWMPDPLAVSEARAIARQAELDAGQEMLF
jgi:hypothetical protein